MGTDLIDPYFLRAKRVEISASITGLSFYLKMGYHFKNGNKELDDEHLYRLEKIRGQNIMNSFDELKETVRRLRAEDGLLHARDVSVYSFRRGHRNASVFYENNDCLRSFFSIWRHIRSYYTLSLYNYRKKEV